MSVKISEISRQANIVIKTIFPNLVTKEDYKKAFEVINDTIMPKKAREGGIELHIWQHVQKNLAGRFGRLFIKKK